VIFAIGDTDFPPVQLGHRPGSNDTSATPQSQEAGMFLRNAWYVAGWTASISERPIRIKMLGEAVAIARLADGGIMAVGDLCPHRYASLSDGRLVNDMIECPYHGLRFDQRGKCVFNPHDGGAIPKRASVKSYPAVDRHGAIWLWMGEADRADPNLIPDFSLFDDEQFAISYGYLHVAAHYELVTDNLLDLSHTEYLHPMLANPGFAERCRKDVRQDGDTVWSYLWSEGEQVTPFFRLIWDGQEDAGDLRSHMRWTSPSSLLLDVGFAYRGCPPETGPAMPNAHFLTPETERSTHYFWLIGRNRKQEDEDLGALIHQSVAQAFAQEDEPMIAKVQQNLEGNGFWDLNPVILRGDAAAVRARRILAKQIRVENPKADALNP